MEIAPIITAICIGCRNLESCMHMKTIKAMSFFGTWRYYWLYDDLKQNYTDLICCRQCMDTFIGLLQEKPFNKKLGKASDNSIEKLCDFIDLYKKYNKTNDELITVSVIYDFVINIREMDNDNMENSLLWKLGIKMLQITIKQNEVSDTDMDPAIVERNKTQITQLCMYSREVCEAVDEVKTNKVLFNYELLKFAYNHWRFNGFPRLELFPANIQERLTRGEIQSPIFKNDNLFFRMQTYNDNRPPF